MRKWKFNPEWINRYKYKLEFLKRSSWFEEIKEKTKTFDKQDKKMIFELAQELFPNSPLQGCLMLDSDTDRPELVELLASTIVQENLSTIDVMFHKIGETIECCRLNYFEDKEFNYVIKEGVEDWEDKQSKRLRISVHGFTVDAVNVKDKTIDIRIHLDRQKGDILQDVEFLLDLARWEAKRLKIDFNVKPKKPQWDVYQRYIEVFDLKRSNPKMEWSAIARRVFPEEVYQNKSSRKKRERIPLRTAIDKVRHYWKEANSMINQGGWKAI